MTTDTKTAAPLSVADIQTRIAAERQRQMIEGNLEQDLMQQRLAPLEAGDDKALDRVEGSLNSCRDRQFRISERIEILESRLVQAIEAEDNAHLDGIADRANRAREMGEQLIRQEYAKHATGLAAVLGKLAAIDAVIEGANRKLERAGRTPDLQSPNLMRCRPSRRWHETVLKRVGLADPLHPYYGRAQGPYNASATATTVRGDDGTTVDRIAEVEVIETRATDPDFPQPLHEMTLPGIGPSLEGHCVIALWDGDKGPTQADVEALLAELDTNTRKTTKVTT